MYVEVYNGDSNGKDNEQLNWKLFGACSSLILNGKLDTANS